MEARKEVIEHPFVTRVKNMLSPITDSPVQKIKDVFQPSHGSLIRDVSFSDYASEFVK